jgi:hypothetical protein
MIDSIKDYRNNNAAYIDSKYNDYYTVAVRVMAVAFLPEIA